MSTNTPLSPQAKWQAFDLPSPIFQWSPSGFFLPLADASVCGEQNTLIPTGSLLPCVLRHHTCLQITGQTDARLRRAWRGPTIRSMIHKSNDSPLSSMHSVMQKHVLFFVSQYQLQSYRICGCLIQRAKASFKKTMRNKDKNCFEKWGDILLIPHSNEYGHSTDVVMPCSDMKLKIT